MDRMIFNTYDKLAEYMFNKAGDGFDITSTLFAEDATELLRFLTKYDEVYIGEINVAQPEYGDYNKEYYVSLSGDMVLTIQPAWYGDEYIYAEPDIMLIHGEASSSIVKMLSLENCIEIYIHNGIYISDAEIEHGAKHRCDKDDVVDALFDNAELIKDSSGDPVGISIDIVKLFKDVFDMV